MRFDDISYNFSIAKVLSILMVAAGHYFQGVLWIPTTFGLFIFAFSSGFFTSRKYQHGVDIRKYWYSKIVRLAYPILIIDIFLLLLFLVQQRPGIVTWQTLPSLVGLTGFLRWFHIEDPSPFGAGLWFITLLLLFYLFYPLLSLLNKNQKTAIVFLLICLVATTLLYYTIPVSQVGHMLWMTAFAFVLGNYLGVHEHPIPLWVFVSLMTASCSALLYLNMALDYKSLNYILILIAAVSINGYLLNKRLPDFILGKFLLLSGCVIQIYFIHTYLFVKSIDAPPLIKFFLSMLIIITTSLLLSKITQVLTSKFNKIQCGRL